MFFFPDQLGRIIALENYPKRIVSAVPSQTELLYELGLEDEVVGITKFCIHPQKWFRTKARVGGTKQLDIKIIQELNPELIIANKEENTKEQIEELEKIFPVWISDVATLHDALAMIGAIGEMCQKQAAAKAMISLIIKNFAEIYPKKKKIRTAYFIWKDPYMAAGGDTFIHEMMGYCGFENIFENAVRYPQTDIRELRKRNCELLLLSNEPFPFNENHIEELAIKIPEIKMTLVDGEMFSWYGSRLIQAPSYFLRLLSEI